MLPRHIADPETSIFHMTCRSKFFTTDTRELQDTFARKHIIIKEDMGFEACKFNEEGLSKLGNIDKEINLQGRHVSECIEKNN